MLKQAFPLYLPKLQIPTGHGGALRCLIPVAFRGGGGGSSQSVHKSGGNLDEYDAKSLKAKSTNNINHIMRLPIGGNAKGKKGDLITATPTTFKENPIKANVPVIREFSVTPLAYRRFDGIG